MRLPHGFRELLRPWAKPPPAPHQSARSTTTIDKAALLLFRDDGNERRLLFVTSPSKPYWLFPGGKREPGESIETALRRELREELSVEVSGIAFLGEVEGYTPEGAPLRIHLFGARPCGAPRPRNEIDGLVWVTHRELEHNLEHLTPITTKEVLPFLAASGLW